MTNINERIYQAQCVDGVEPIEHMVPYPNLRSLIDGQNIKYGKKMVYADFKLTSDDIYKLAQQTANWLESEGISSNDRILIKNLKSPDAEILAFGIWVLGASIILNSDDSFVKTEKIAKMTISSETNFFKKIKLFPECHNPKFKPLLHDEAMIFWNNGNGIRLSHYNLLVNTNGIQHGIDLFENQTFHVNLKSNSMPWVILQLILPLYSGAPLTSKNPDIKLGLKGCDYNICFNWKKIEKTLPPSIYVCNLNTAFISINKSPLHLTGLNHPTNPTAIKGHSVMMGYLDNNLNEKAFKNNELKIF